MKFFPPILFLFAFRAFCADVNITNVTHATTADTNILVLGMPSSAGPTRLYNGALLKSVLTDTNLDSMNAGTLTLSNVTASRVLGTDAQGIVTNLPAGTAGQIVTSTGSGYAWSNAPTSSGSSPTTTFGDIIIRGRGGDERLPMGAFRLLDDMMPTSTTVTREGATLLGAGGGTASFSAATVAALRAGRNNFARLRIYGTNGVGATHYARYMPNGAVATYTLWNTNNFDSVLAFEGAVTNSLMQVGLLSSATTSNQTAGIFFEINQAVSGTLRIRTIGGSSTNFDTGLPVDVNTLYKIGWTGTTNSMVFYTNNVACFTNAYAPSMPGGTDMFVGAILLNRNDAPATINTLFMDRFFMWETQ